MQANKVTNFILFVIAILLLVGISKITNFSRYQFLSKDEIFDTKLGKIYAIEYQYEKESKVVERDFVRARIIRRPVQQIQIKKKK